MRLHPESIRSKRPPRVTVYRCINGHIYFNPHPDCPECGAKLRPASTIGEGLLVTHTLMSVTPSGSPLHLGIVQRRGGSRTLCRIIGPVRGHGHDRVWLLRLDGIYYALGRRGRRRVARNGLRGNR